MTFPTLYKRDTKGKIRVWSMEQDGERHRTISGLQDGALTHSGWTVCVGKQGRTDEEQARFEIDSGYRYQLEREYHETLETIDQPKFFKPMLAHKYEGWTGKWGFTQPKLDGIRCITTKDGMFSREGKPILGAPHIFEVLKPLFANFQNLVLDGELYNHDLKDDFNSIVSAVKKQKPTAADLEVSKNMVQYHVYDLPAVAENFERRIEVLGQFLEEFDDAIKIVDTYTVTSSEEYDDLHAQFLGLGYEGSMFRANGPYEQKRSKLLLKRKEFQDAEYECVAIEEGLGNWSGLAKRVVCRLPDGRTFGAGIKGNQARAKELLNETHKLVTVQFFQLTPDGIPRFPVVTKFHGDGERL